MPSSFTPFENCMPLGLIRPYSLLDQPSPNLQSSFKNKVKRLIAILRLMNPLSEALKEIPGKLRERS